MITNTKLNTETGFLYKLLAEDGVILVGINFRGLNKNDTNVRFKIHGHGIFYHN